MYRIIKIEMDVHSKNYTLCAMESAIGEEDRIFVNIRDALTISQCLSYGGYHAVYIPTQDDDSIKEYLCMHDD